MNLYAYSKLFSITSVSLYLLTIAAQLLIFIYIIFMPESTEREILKNFEEIVETSLPLKSYYEECAGSAKQVVLNYVTFSEQRKLVSTNMYIVAEEK